MKIIKTHCRICEAECPLLAEVHAENVILKPNRAHPISRGFSCSKGLMFGQVNTSTKRLNTPLARSVSANGEADFIPQGWDDSLGEIADKLSSIMEQYGPGAIATYVGNPASASAKTVNAIQQFEQKMGVNKRFSALTLDCANKFVVSKHMFHDPMFHTIPDLDNTHFFLCLGSNPMVSKMSFVSVANPIKKIRDIMRRNGEVVYVDPRLIESAQGSASQCIQIKPDTDVYFLAAILHEIKKRHGFHIRDIPEQRELTRFSEFEQFIEPFSASQVQSITGVSAEQIIAVADSFATKPSASVHMSVGVNMGRQGTLGYWLCFMLSIVTNNLGRAGGNLFPRRLINATQHSNEGDQFVNEQVPKVFGELPASMLADSIDTLEDPIKALIVIAGNPLLSMGGERRLRDTLTKLDLLIVIDLFKSATAELADYLLPATDWLERDDFNLFYLGQQLSPHIQFSQQVLPAKGQRWEEWKILYHILLRIGLENKVLPSTEEKFGYVKDFLLEHNLSLKDFVGKNTNSVVLDKKKIFAVSSSEIEQLLRRLDYCSKEFNELTQRAGAIFKSHACGADTQIKLICLRDKHRHNSWLDVKSLRNVRGKSQNALHINPLCARRHSISEGQLVDVTNDNGRVTLPAYFDRHLREDVVAVVHGWGGGKGRSGTNVGQLLPVGMGSFEPLSGQLFMTGIPVYLHPISQNSGTVTNTTHK